MDYSLWLLSTLFVVCLLSIYRWRDVWLYEINLVLSESTPLALCAPNPQQPRPPRSASAPRPQPNSGQRDSKTAPEEPKGPFAFKPTAGWTPARANCVFESMEEDNVLLVEALRVTRTKSVYLEKTHTRTPLRDSRIIFKARGASLTRRVLNHRLAVQRPELQAGPSRAARKQTQQLR